MFGFGPLEWIIVLVIFFIFFGAGKLGELGGALGRGIKLFKQNAALDEPSDEKKPKDRSA